MLATDFFLLFLLLFPSSHPSEDLCTQVVPQTFDDCNRVQFQIPYKCCFVQRTSGNKCVFVDTINWEEMQNKAEEISAESPEEKVQIKCDLSVRNSGSLLKVKYLIEIGIFLLYI